jgi:lysophospholipase L1-like esterase
MKTILFQGDSISDAGRDRSITEPNQGLGEGYIAVLSEKFKEAGIPVNIYNRGVSGNRIGDMYARWIEDTLNIDHDILNILNGVNDVGFMMRLNRGASRSTFEFMYDRCVYEALERRPETALIFCQPFLLKRDTVWEPYGNDIFVNFDRWAEEIAARGEIVEGLAKKYGAIYVPMWDALKEAEKTTPVEELIQDCVHPAPVGCRVLADIWMKTVRERIQF